jgi:hypothetical protein
VAVVPDGRRNRHDPYWDLDGAGVRRARTRRRIVSGLAFVAALAACGAVAFAWAIKVGLLPALSVG